jgi:hypothetical protein
MMEQEQTSEAKTFFPKGWLIAASVPKSDANRPRRTHHFALRIDGLQQSNGMRDLNRSNRAST